MISLFLTILYFIALGGLSIYGLHRLWLLFCWYKIRQESRTDPPIPRTWDKRYKITVQLPIYNERFVAARLLDAVARLDWPTDRLEIQVLDDSTDDTRDIIDERVAFWTKKGIFMQVLRRNERVGFKAGALAEGTTSASGEFIAVFDADFIPKPDFLMRAVPYFSNPKVGMVQGRWGFINSEHSWFTHIQALLLGPHFGIEHRVRFKRGLFFNFNGTAGIWRRKAIETAGGWQSSTVTEDLDLSYRAQLAGWRFIYLNDLVVPSELPVTLSGFRSQQQRWAKGSIQTAKKILPMLFSSQSLTPAQKTEAAFHLLANLGWLLGAIVTLTLYPAISWRVGTGPYQLLRLDLPLLFGSSGAIILYFLWYALSEKNRSLVLELPLLPILTIGMAPSIAFAVLEGAFCKGGHFERTPKFGSCGRDHLPISASKYYRKNFLPIIINMVFFTYTLLPLMFSFHRGTWIALPFLSIFPFGFFLVLVKDIQERFHVSKK